MKNLVKFCSKLLYRSMKYGMILIMLLSMTSVVVGQVKAPATGLPVIELATKPGHVAHGYDVAGTATSADEVTEIVTVGADMRYFVYPSPLVSPNYVFVPGSPGALTNVNSTFTWSFEGTTLGSTAIVQPVTGGPYITVQWNSIGSTILRALETPNSTQGTSFCVSGSEPHTQFPVQVIKRPEIRFTEISTGVYYEDYCNAALPPTSKNFNLTVDNANEFTGGVKIIYNLWHTPITGNRERINIGENQEADITLPTTTTGTLNIDRTWDYGLYEIEIHSVSDRISRKSGVASVEGDILASASKFTYEVKRPVETGPIYRLPNLISP